MDAVQRWLTLVTLVAAALAALGYLVRQGWRLFKLLEHVAMELTPNHGSSMKDDMTSVARAVGELQAEVRELGTTKRLEHQVLQLQLDGLRHELGLTRAQEREEGRHVSSDSQGT